MAMNIKLTHPRPTRRLLDSRCARILFAVLIGVVASSALHAADRAPVTSWDYNAEDVALPQGKPAAYIPEDMRRMFKIVDDPDAAGGKALQVAIDKRIIRELDVPVLRTPNISRDDAPVGLYKVTVRMKMTGMLNVIGTAIRLTGKDLPPTAGKKPNPNGRYDEPTIHGYMFKDADLYQDFTFTTEVVEPDHVSLRPNRERPKNPLSLCNSIPSKARMDRMLAGQPPLPEDQKEAELERATKITEADKAFAAGGLHVNMSILHVISVGFGRSRNSIQTLTIDKIHIERVPEPDTATVRQVLPQKVLVRPGEEQVFHVWLHNRSGKPQSGDVKLRVTHGFDESIDAGSKQVVVAPGKYAVVSVPWKTRVGEDLWGCTVTAEFLKDGKATSSAEDVFSVHSNPWAVMNFGGSHRNTNPYFDPPDYRNFQEFFGPTVGDGVKPATDDPTLPHLSGVAGYNTHLMFQKLLVDHNRSIGVASFMYLWPGATSYPVQEAFEKHPEWFGGRLNWTDQASDLYFKATDALVQNWTKGEQLRSPALYSLITSVNDAADEVYQNKITSIIKNLKIAGYDGVRWDADPFALISGYYAGQRYGLPEGADSTAKNVEMIRHFKEALRKEFPNYTEAANGVMGELGSKAWNRNYELPPIESNPPFIEFLKDGSSIMDEGWMNAWLFRDPRNIIKDYYWGVRRQTDACRRAGGFLHTFSPARDNVGYFTQSTIYYNHLAYLAGAQYPGAVSCSPGSETGLSHLLTRYSQFVWDNKLMWLTDAAKKIRIDSSVDLWWEDAAVYRTLPDGRMRYVIPVVNPPTTERFYRDQFSELPEPVREPLPVEVKLPEGYSKAKVRMITAEPRTSHRVLPSRVEGGAVRFELPELVLYRVLVVEFEK